VTEKTTPPATERPKNDLLEQIKQVADHKDVKRNNHSSYLKGRPFLFVKNLMSPADNVKTEVKSWVNTLDNWRVDETHFLADHVSNRAMIESSVIIDILNAKVVKNRHREAQDSEGNFVAGDDIVLEYYLMRYKESVKEGVSRWLDKKGIENRLRNKIIPA
jgi:hypothetical protein